LDVTGIVELLINGLAAEHTYLICVTMFALVYVNIHNLSVVTRPVSGMFHIAVSTLECCYHACTSASIQNDPRWKQFSLKRTDAKTNQDWNDPEMSVVCRVLNKVLSMVTLRLHRRTLLFIHCSVW